MPLQNNSMEFVMKLSHSNVSSTFIITLDVHMKSTTARRIVTIKIV